MIKANVIIGHSKWKKKSTRKTPKIAAVMHFCGGMSVTGSGKCREFRSQARNFDAKP